MIGILLKISEEGKTSEFADLQNHYKNIKDRTDLIIDYLIENYDIDEIIDSVSEELDLDKEETINSITFMSLVDKFYIKKLENGTMEAYLYEEENYRALYYIYLWALNNGYVNERIKKSLHIFVQLSFTNSQFIRNYFSGEYDEANRISNPDSAYGNMLACEYAMPEYQFILTKKVKEANGFEIFDGEIISNSFDAKKKLLELEFATICLLLKGRDIIIPAINDNISDFTIKILEKASYLSDEYIDKLNKDKIKKIIRL